MKNALAEIVLPQLDELIAKFEELERRGLTNVSIGEASEFITSSMAAIHRAAGANSQFAVQANAIEKIHAMPIQYRIPYVGGVLKALRDAIASGYLVSAQELIHAEIFADFLEMADYLLEEGYKDPAAVLAGGVLEQHIRKLCQKNNIATVGTTPKGDRPKNFNDLNVELAKANVYSKIDQQNVTAWYALRNKAAHGLYDEYTKKQVALMVQGVCDFLSRHPA